MTLAESDGGVGEDRLSALPDDPLLHILSFLPSDDAVRASVLARRWRHLWKSTRTLRVTWRGNLTRRRTWGPWRASTLTNFMSHLLLLRGAAATAPLDRCEILCGDLHCNDFYEDDLPTIYKRKLDDDLNKAAGLWIRHALAIRHVRELVVRLRSRRRLRLDGVSFAAAPRLTKVELAHASFAVGPSIDFTMCPVLEELKMSFCKIHVDRIYSPSLTRLSIGKCCSFDGKRRTRVSTPRLVLLRLTVSSGRAPVLESMPMLVDADITIEDWCDDMCSHNVCNNSVYSDLQRGHGSKEGCFCVDEECCSCVDEDGSGVYLEDLTCCDSCFGTDNGSSVLLEGLSRATELELVSDPSVFILRKDCKSPNILFNRLKILLLNEWCMVVDFGALVFFLQRSPVLEELTLELGHCETRHPVVETDKSYRPTEQLFVVSKQLMIVEIKCTEENELVKKLLMLLTTNGVHQDQIHIQHNFYPPDLSGYDANSDYDDDG